MIVADAWQNKRVATYLMNALIEAARARGLKSMKGDILASNTSMIQLAKHLGFVITKSDDPTVKNATKML